MRYNFVLPLPRFVLHPLTAAKKLQEFDLKH